MASAFPSSVMAQELDYTDITPRQAYWLIRRHSSSDMVILDVRNDSEYTFEHLYNSMQIPCYLLERLIELYEANPNADIIDYRSVELMAHINDPVIVYCAKGNRSEIACNVLAENGFTKVYNIVGGIEAWVQVSLPIYNTAHSITIETARRFPKIMIERLVSNSATSGCGQGQCSDGDLIQNVEVTDIEQNETYTETQVTFDLNGTSFENIASQNILWTYTSNTKKSNVTASFLSINSVGDTNMQSYLLKYDIQHVMYNFSVATKLIPLDEDIYNSSGTIVRFFPIGKTKLQSIEIANFTSPVTLSGLYRSLEKACQKLARTHRSDGRRHDDDTLKGLADSYYKMAKGLHSLSKLVKNELRAYDREILQNIAILTDDACSDCQLWCGILYSFLVCGVWYEYVVGTLICSTLIPAGGIGFVACELMWITFVTYFCYVSESATCLEACINNGFCTPQTFYVDGIHAVTEYGENGEVNYPTNLVGIEDDNYCAHIAGPGNGEGGNIWCIMNAPAHGEIKVRTVSIVPISTYLHVYIMDPFTEEWVLLNYALVNPAPGLLVVSFGTFNANFDYLAIAAYNAEGPSNIVIDNIKVVN